MIDLHTHTVYSDGVLIPAEHVRRAKVAGYQAVAITDHADVSNMEHILSNLLRFSRKCGHFFGIEVLVGVELTHNPPGLTADLTEQARDMGAQLVVVHGETVTEPVDQGTNLAAIEAGVDILAHPGLLTDVEAALAAEKGVALEVTTRKGHSLTNGLVVSLARKHGCAMVIDNDAHGPGDFVSREMRRSVALGAGMTTEEMAAAEDASRSIVERALRG